MILNLKYTKLKLFNFAVKPLGSKLIIALFDIGATCPCISHHLFMKISDKVDMMQKLLQVNTASGIILGPIRHSSFNM